MYIGYLKAALIGCGFILFSCVFSANASAATIYANYSTGNDTTGNGTVGTPYKTFNKAYTVASSGDTLDLTGTFSWANADETGDASTSGYTLAKNLTIQGHNADQTIIQAATSSGSGDRRVFTVTTGYTVTINNVTIRYGRGNSASGGCTLVPSGATLNIDKSEIYGCTTWIGYAGAMYLAGTATITNSSIYSNSAYYDVGGVWVYNGNLTLTNSTVYSNESNRSTGYGYYGGGIMVGYDSGVGGTATITNSTITGNYANYGGGGIWLYNNASSVLYLKNSIVAGNSSNNGTTYNNLYKNASSVVNDGGYNVVGASTGFTATTGDWTDQNNDGTYNLFSIGTTGTLNLDTQVSFNDNPYVVRTYGLLSSSIAINNAEGTANNGVSIPATDQRGAARAGATDIGAFEYNGTGLAVAEPTTQGASITYSLVGNKQLTANWTNGNGLKRVVFVKQANTGTALPVDGTTYTASTTFGSGTQIGTSGWYCVYNGLGTSVAVTGLTHGTDYIFQVFEYNGVTLGTEDYFTNTATDNPKSQATHTPTTLYANYSTGSDSTGNGTSGSPYKSFHKIYTMASGGDTLDLTGTFTWSNSDETGDANTSGYTIGKDLIIQGHGPTQTIIQAATATSTADRRVFTVGSGYSFTINSAMIRFGYTSSYGSGGCILINSGSTFAMDKSDVNNCRAYVGYGGGVYVAGTATVTNSSLYANWAYYDGGSLQVSGGGNLTVVNSTIYSNNLPAYPNYEGAGIMIGTGDSDTGTATVINSTITGNFAPYGGAGIFLVNNANAILNIKNSIVAVNDCNNRANGYSNIFKSSSAVINSGGYNIIGASSGYSATTGDWTDSNNDGVYNLYSIGTTGSLYLDSAASINDNPYNLKTYGFSSASSIAINNANDTTYNSVAIPSIDQRGATRNGATDIGSFEYNGGGLSVTQPTTQASSVSFASVNYTTMTASWTNGSGAKRVVFVKQDTTGTATPVDGTDYTANAAFGSGTQIGASGWYCVYNGVGSSVALTGLVPSTSYIAQVFEYNGVASGQADYFTDTATNNPLAQATTTLAVPGTQASNITFSSLTTTSMTVSWTNGNGAKRVVFAKQANTGTATPVNDTNYTASTTFGSGTQIGTSGWYTVYNNTGTSVSVTGLTINTPYIFQVFEYNSTGSYYIYNANTGTNNPVSQNTVANEPTTQATNVAYSSVGANSLTISWTSGNGANRAVFMKQASSGSATPVDQTTYTANTAFGSGTQISSSGWYCVYNGSGTSVSVTGLSANTAYRTQVFEYNGTTGLQNYITSTGTGNPANQTTLVAYTLTYTAGANGAVSGSTPQSVSSGGSGTAVTAVPNTGYHFVNWSDASTANPRTDVNVLANVSVTANFAINTYTLSYVAGSHGSLTGTTSQTVNYNTSGSAVTAVADSGYSFVNWSDGSMANPRTDSNVAANVSVTANFSSDTYTLTYSAGANGTISGTTPQIISTGSDGTTVTAVPNTGYHFTSWSDGGLTASRTDTNVTQNLSVTANFVINTYSLSYAAGAHGSLTGTTSQTVNYNSSGSAVTAVPDTGYHFVNWTDGSTANPRTDSSVVANHSVTANFAINIYTLSYSPGSNGTINGSTSQTVNYNGSGSAVTAVPNVHYAFSSWSDGVLTATRTDSSVTQDVSVTANFTFVVATIYANSATGNDSTGNGTSGAPYKTFNKAYLASSSGDTIDLTGTFTWTDALETGDSAISGYTINKNLTLQGHGADTTILQAAASDNIATARVLTISSGTTLTINDLAIRYGKLTDASNDGGGIKNSGVTTINNCEIYSNRATGSYGGGIANWNKFDLNRSTVYNNVAHYMGGGLVNSYYVASGGYLNITNSTVVRNQVTAVTAYTEGGGVHYRKGGGAITNSTIAYNSACGVGGVGMDDSAGTLSIKNSILAKNIRLNHSYCHNGLAPVDFDFRTAGAGNVTDNGNNIIGYSYRYTWAGANEWVGATSWANALSWNKSTFTLRGTATTGSLNLDSSLALNGNTNKTQTLALLSGSIAINNGATGSNGTITVPTTDQRNDTRSGATDIGAFEYDGAPADVVPPEISGITAEATDNTATISWSTNEESSSQVAYDPTSYLTTFTPIYNSNIRTLGHEVVLSNLISCSKYYYKVISQDEAGNEGSSETKSFSTTGCPANVPISGISELTFTPATVNGAEVVNPTTTASDSDYLVSQTAGGLTFSVAIPRTFSEKPVSLQLKGLDADDVIGSLSTPRNYNSVGSAVFDIKALADPVSTITSFDPTVTITLAYQNSDIAGVDESTLRIYRNNDGAWTGLSGCVVDRNAKTVTCSTNHFSVFGLFGEPSGSSPNGSEIIAGPNTSRGVNAEIAKKITTKKKTAEVKIKKTDLFPRDLKFGEKHEDVRRLQQYLKDYGLNVAVTGYFGPQTKTAVVQLQKNNGIKPAQGYFGIATRTIINEGKVIALNLSKVAKLEGPKQNISKSSAGMEKNGIDKTKTEQSGPLLGSPDNKTVGQKNENIKIEAVGFFGKVKQWFGW